MLLRRLFNIQNKTCYYRFNTKKKDYKFKHLIKTLIEILVVSSVFDFIEQHSIPL